MDGKPHISAAEPSQNWLEKIAATILIPKSSDGFMDLVDLAVKKGTIDLESREMIKGVLNVASSSVGDIMIPRTQMVTLHTGMDSKEITKTVIKSTHTRLPLLSENREDIMGILHTKDLLKIILEHRVFSPEHIETILRPAIFVPESKKLDALLRDFKSNHNHLAVVVDEYGAISGLVTIEDILEEIVGNIEDEFDEQDKHITKINETEYTVNALTEIENFNDYFDTNIDGSEVDTIGGLIVSELKHLPKVGEEVKIGDITFCVAAADRRRILGLHVYTHSQ